MAAIFAPQRITGAAVFAAASGVVLPTLSGATGVSITSVGFVPRIIAGSGVASTLYWVAYANGGGTPTGAQIVAGQDSTGSAALASGSEAYSGAGTYDEATAITSLSASTAYRVAWVAYDGTSYSDVVVSAAITTAADISPSTGHVVVTGRAPSVSQPVGLAPSTGHVVVTGKQPAVSQPRSVSPSVGHVVITGRQPTISQPTGLSPSTGHVVVTGRTPAVSQPITVAPATGHIVVSGRAPTVSQPTGLSPSTGHIVVTGRQPSISQPRSVSPAPGHVVVLGRIPGVSQSVALAPAAGHIVITGRTPAVSQPRSVSPSTGHIVITGRVPLVLQTVAGLRREVIRADSYITTRVDRASSIDLEVYP